MAPTNSQISADHASEAIVACAYCLFVLSLVAIWLPTGLLIRGAGWLIAGGALAGWVAAGLWLFSQWAFFEFPWRLLSHTLGGAILVVWIGVPSSQTSR